MTHGYYWIEQQSFVPHCYYWSLLQKLRHLVLLLYWTIGSLLPWFVVAQLLFDLKKKWLLPSDLNRISLLSIE